MTVTVVSGASPEGWEQYGRRFVETFREHWPSEIELRFCGDGPRYPGFPSDMRYHDRLAESAALRNFQERHARNEIAHGRRLAPGQIGWSERKLAECYNFRYDAVRFCNKVFSIELVARTAPPGWLVWLDADIVTFARVPAVLFEALLPPGFALACLDRGNYHSECGFVGYNLQHPATLGFIRRFAAVYASDEVFALEEWHDSWVFDYLRRRERVPSYSIPHCSPKQPFINSVLGAYMDHLKGSSKTRGKSLVTQMLAGHNHQYWLT